MIRTRPLEVWGSEYYVAVYAGKPGEAEVLFIELAPYRPLAGPRKQTLHICQIKVVMVSPMFLSQEEPHQSSKAGTMTPSRTVSVVGPAQQRRKNGTS